MTVLGSRRRVLALPIPTLSRVEAALAPLMTLVGGSRASNAERGAV